MSGGHTPGPWAWMGSPHGLYLATTHSGRQYVMGFRRMGFNSAQPVFRDRHRMVPAADIVQFEVGDPSVRGFAQAKETESVYRLDVDGIDNADARLIAAAPDLLEALIEARQTILDLKNARWSECEGSDADWVGEIDAALAKARQSTPAPDCDGERR